jgi:hypothetical protein
MYTFLARLRQVSLSLGALAARRRNNKNRDGWRARFAAAHQALARELDEEQPLVFSSKSIGVCSGRVKARLTELCGGAK